jgi:hypothetical protein
MQMWSAATTPICSVRGNGRNKEIDFKTSVFNNVGKGKAVPVLN